MIPDILRILLVVFGIGLVIFVHELGHYLAARWCGARVEVFSLGFGPRMFGWKRGDTLFQVAVVPLGGYVKVAGEYYEPGGRTSEPGTLNALNVPQRFLYYSGGVIMNVIFALVVLPLVMFAGLPALEPVIGSPTPGLPAWQAGVPAGSRILSVNGTEIIDFEHLVTAAALNGSDPAEVKVLAPGAQEPEVFQLKPQFDEGVGFYRLGFPAGIAADGQLVVREESPAALAGLTADDRLVSVVGQPVYLTLDDQMARAVADRGPITLEVLRPDGSSQEISVTPEIRDGDARRIGVGALSTLIRDIRSTGESAATLAVLDLRADDVIQRVQGETVWTVTGVREALIAHEGSPLYELDVLRNGEVVQLTAARSEGRPLVQLVDDIAFGIVQQSSRVTITPGSPCEAAGLLDGDRVMSVNGNTTDDWEGLLTTIQAEVAAGREVELLVWRDGEEGTSPEKIPLSVKAEAIQIADYGVAISAARTILRADTLGEAVGSGVAATRRFLVDVWLQLKKMLFSKEISTKNLGGIISISVISFDTAGQGLPKLFFFLAILSINLAIINLLPIPILDGGHLLFLLIEGIKGSPVSERTFGYSQVVGLVMIMSLMVYVTYQDIVRWFITKP